MMAITMHRLWRVMKRVHHTRTYVFGTVRDQLAEGSSKILTAVSDERARILDEIRVSASQGHVPDALFLSLLQTHYREHEVRAAWRNSRVYEAHSLLADLASMFPEPAPLPDPAPPPPPNVHVIGSVRQALQKGIHHG